MHSRLLNLVMIALLGLAGLELAYSIVTKRAVHSFRDTVSSVSLGIGQQALNVFLASAFLGVYGIVHAKLAVAESDPHVWWHWLLLVFACDFSYYVGHRAAHNVNLFIAGHIVHHQAEDFNLLSSLRQSWTAWILMAPFFLPLALAVPLEMFVVGQLGIMFFQFISHAGAFRLRLGVLDRVFITPRNHRVHHGDRAPYWGANCGGMFVLWDRALGTYVEEDPNVPLRAGAGIRLNFYDPFEANIEYYRRIFFVSRRRQGLSSKLKIWFQSPEVLAEELVRHGYELDKPVRDVNRAPLSPGEKKLIVLAMVVALGVFAAHRALFERFPLPVNLATGIAVFVGLWLLGALLSGTLNRPAEETAATSARGTHSGSRTSAMLRAHRADDAGRSREIPSLQPRTSARCVPERDEPRTPCRAHSEILSSVSGRSVHGVRGGRDS